MNWYVLRVKSRQEKKISDALEKIGLKTYCPMINVVRQWSDRKKKMTVPVFNSYVFVQSEECNRNKVFQVQGVLSFLFWLKKPAIVREEEIELLKTHLSDSSDKMKNFGVKINDKILVSRGVFKGMECVVKEVTNNKLKVLFSNLGFKVSLSAKNIA